MLERASLDVAHRESGFPHRRGGARNHFVEDLAESQHAANDGTRDRRRGATPLHGHARNDGQRDLFSADPRARFAGVFYPSMLGINESRHPLMTADATT